MNGQDKIKALAELDGWTELVFDVRGAGAPERNPSWHGKPPGKNCIVSCLDYPGNYNFIIPLIQKLNIWSKFLDVTYSLYAERLQAETVGKDANILMLTPDQLCDALLIATGKMKQ